MALKDAVKTLGKCESVIVESSLFRFWGDHQADVYDIMSFMKENGFVLHDILDGIFRPHDRALAQVDLAFVRENGPFRKYRHYNRAGRNATERPLAAPKRACCGSSCPPQSEDYPA